MWRVCPTRDEHGVFVCRVSLKCERLSAPRRGLGADGVEQHPADGDQRPEETLREKRADRSQDERAAAPGLSRTAVSLLFVRSPVCFHRTVTPGAK